MALMLVTSTELPIALSTATAASPHALVLPAPAVAVVTAPPDVVVGAGAVDAAADVAFVAPEVTGADACVDAEVFVVVAEDPHAASVSRTEPATTDRRLG